MTMLARTSNLRLRWHAGSSRWAAAVAMFSVAAAVGARGLTQADSIASEVSVEEMNRTLRAIDVDRTSGGDGERDSAAYLDRKLTEYGVAHTTHHARLYLSWPGSADIAVPGLDAVAGKTAAFSGVTAPEGIRGPLVFAPPLTRRVDRTLEFGTDVRGRIPVVRGIADTEALVLAAKQAGALLSRTKAAEVVPGDGSRCERDRGQREWNLTRALFADDNRSGFFIGRAVAFSKR